MSMNVFGKKCSGGCGCTIGGVFGKKNYGSVSMPMCAQCTQRQKETNVLCREDNGDTSNTIEKEDTFTALTEEERILHKIKALEKRLEIQLPDDYRQFLCDHWDVRENPEIITEHGVKYRIAVANTYDDAPGWFITLDRMELMQWGARLPYVKTPSYQRGDMEREHPEGLKASDGTTLSWKRVYQMLKIGESGGDPLLLDPSDNYSVWVDYNSHKIANSFGELLNTGTIPQIIPACRNNDYEKVRTLVESGADVNFDDGEGNTPLIVAAEKGYLPIVEYLVEKGADVNNEVVWNYSDGASKHSALYNACTKNMFNTAEYLIKKGADVNFVDMQGFSVLQRSNDLSIITLLVQSGADINYRDRTYGCTPLHLAIDNHQKDIAHFFIDHGADVSIKDNDGKTASDYAKENELDTVLEKITQKIGYIRNSQT